MAAGGQAMLVKVSSGAGESWVTKVGPLPKTQYVRRPPGPEK